MTNRYHETTDPLYHKLSQWPKWWNHIFDTIHEQNHTTNFRQLDGLFIAKHHRNLSYLLGTEIIRNVFLIDRKEGERESA